MEVAVACSSILCDLVHAFASVCDELHPVIACVKRGFFVCMLDAVANMVCSRCSLKQAASLSCDDRMLCHDL